MPRGIDLSKFRGNSDSEDGDAPPIKKRIVLDSFKQDTFSHGTRKKTKKELEKEEEERKRKEEEVAAAKAYKEFEDWFGADDSSSVPRGGTSSGRGGAYGRRELRAGGGFVKGGTGDDARGQAYQPPRTIPTGTSREHREPHNATRSPSPSFNPKTKAKGARAMDSFLEEIKKEQQHREQKYSRVAQSEGISVSAMAAWEKNRGSHDIGDSETTNLYISNLPNGISEASLGNFFAKIGPVGAVKIMWPRGDEDTSIGAGITTTRRSKAGLSGFVAYMKRKDAEIAVKELDGLDWGGSLLRVGWSKMVRIPPRPLYEVASKSANRRDSRSPRRRDRTPFRSRSPSRDRYDHHDHSRNVRRSSSRTPPPSRYTNSRGYDREQPLRTARGAQSSKARSDSRSPPAPRESRSYSSSGTSRSRSPRRDRKSRTDIVLDKMSQRIGPEKEKFIRAVAGRVKSHGYKFEDVLRDREKDNEKFAFLRSKELPEYHLYKYCVDSRYRLPTPPPDDFADEGKAELYSSDSAEDSERERMHRTNKGHLGKLARKRLEAGLRGMTGEREQIARLMEFAMVHADAVDEVTEIICQSLRIESTAVPRKLARLYLISDILHNSSSSLPNVWRYRNAFESRLPDVMEHMADVHRSLVAHSGKLSGETFKSQVAFVIEIWENWILFTSDVTDKLRSILNGASAHPIRQDDAGIKSKPSNGDRDSQLDQPLAVNRFKKATAGGFKSTFVAAGPAEAVSELAAGVTTNEEDLDGEEMEDLDGEQLDEDLDGDAMEEEEDLDGEAM